MKYLFIVYIFISTIALSQTIEDLNLNGMQEFKNKNYKQAINLFSKAIKIDSKHPQLYYNRGLSYFKLNNYKNALQDFSNAIILDAKYIDAYFDRGLIYHDVGKHIDAINDFTTVIKLDPKYELAYYYRGFSRMGGLEDYKNAIIDFSKVIEINPNNANAYMFRGQAKVLMKNHVEGCKDLHKSKELGADGAETVIRWMCNK